MDNGNGIRTGRVVKVYPDLGCVRVLTTRPADELDYVPVTQKLRGVYGMPAEGDTVLLLTVNGGALTVCTDIVPMIAVRAYTRRYKARPPKHLDDGKEPKVPFHERLRHNVIVDNSVVKIVNIGRTDNG